MNEACLYVARKGTVFFDKNLVMIYLSQRRQFILCCTSIYAWEMNKFVYASKLRKRLKQNRTKFRKGISNNGAIVYVTDDSLIPV